jgi:hypothetical protein
MIKLIWTFDGTVEKTFTNETHRIVLINHYILSIMTAKKLGYYTIIYCDKNSEQYFKEVVDEIIFLENNLYKNIWDYPKLYVLENRDDEFILIDGDVILNKKLPEFSEDLMFDTFEHGNWEIEYLDIVKKLDMLGIKEIIPFWSVEQIPVINTGILCIKNIEFKNEYIRQWKILYQWIFSLTETFDKTKIAMVNSQFLLSILVKNHNVKLKKMNKYVSEKGEYYTHYFGVHKFMNNLVPDDKIMKSKKSIV